MEKPARNLPRGANQWGRFVESQQDDFFSRFEDVYAELVRLGNSDGSQAQLYAQLMVGPIALLQDQVKQLYTATGNTYPPTPSAPAPPPAPVPTYTTIVTNATWSRTWGSSTYYTGGGYYTDAGMLYQGSNPENKIGMWGIDMGSAGGKRITDMQVFLQNTDFPWASSGTAAMGIHSNASAPTGKPGRSNGWDVGFAEGQGKFFGVPSAFWGGFSNGTFKGFTVGGIGPNDANSAIFAGAGRPGQPQLKITYQN